MLPGFFFCALFPSSKPRARDCFRFGNRYTECEKQLSFQPMTPPKRFDISPPDCGMLRRSRCVQIFVHLSFPVRTHPCSWSTEKGKRFSPVQVGTRDFGLAIQFRPSCPASACSFSTLRLNLMLSHGIPSAFFRDGVIVHLFIIYYLLYRQPPPGQSRVYIRSRNLVPMRRLLPNVRQHRASSPQGSSRNECCLVMFHLGAIFMPLFFHTL